MLKKSLVINALFLISSIRCMEPIEPDPFTRQEIKELDVRELIKNLDGEPQDCWKEVVEYFKAKARFTTLNDSLGPRLFKTPTPILRALSTKLDETFFKLEYHPNSHIWGSIELTLDEWAALKKVYVYFLRIGDKDAIKRRREQLLGFALVHDDFDFAKYLVEEQVEQFHSFKGSSGSFIYQANSKKLAQLLYPYMYLSQSSGDFTLLHSACTEKKQADLVPFYLEKGFNVQSKDFCGKTPLIVLAERAIGQTVEQVQAKLSALLNAGADPCAPFNYKSLVEFALIHKVKDKTGDEYHPDSVDLFVKMISDAGASKK